MEGETKKAGMKGKTDRRKGERKGGIKGGRKRGRKEGGRKRGREEKRDGAILVSWRKNMSRFGEAILKFLCQVDKNDLKSVQETTGKMGLETHSEAKQKIYSQTENILESVWEQTPKRCAVSDSEFLTGFLSKS